MILVNFSATFRQLIMVFRNFLKERKREEENGLVYYSKFLKVNTKNYYKLGIRSKVKMDLTIIGLDNRKAGGLKSENQY